MFMQSLTRLFFALSLASLLSVASAQAGSKSEPSTSAFKFPLVSSEHEQMQRLLSNALAYLKPQHALLDPVSGYPVEGWNNEPQRGLFLRSFTQLTAIGEQLEILANIAAGYADNPYLSRAQAFAQLERILSSLLADQADPRISDKGLLVNFLGFGHGARFGPLSEEVTKSALLKAFDEPQAEQIWAALIARGWIIPQQDGMVAKIVRQGEYGGLYFTGELAPFADYDTREKIMAILDQRVVQIIFGDNANLTASVAKAFGALRRSTVVNDPRSAALREQLEQFITRQEAGYRFFYDQQAQSFYFGWNATHDRFTGWEDGNGQWVIGHMDYFINEFRGPLTFVVQRFNLPTAAIKNSRFRIQPYRLADGRDLYTLATWNGSAFESLGLSLFMRELDTPGWRETLHNAVAIKLDYAQQHYLPGLLSEAYSGNGVEYTGSIGIPELAVNDKPRITDAPSLYMLGIAYAIAPEAVERFLADNQHLIKTLFTEEGPLEVYYTTQQSPITFQTTAHTLALILGGIGSANENMQRYQQWRTVPALLEVKSDPSPTVDFLSDPVQWISWSPSGDLLAVERADQGIQIRSEAVLHAFITVQWPLTAGVNLANGALRLRYRTAQPLEAMMTLADQSAQIQNEILVRFDARSTDMDAEIRIPLPATPALENITELVLRFGDQRSPAAVDLTITGFEFIPSRNEVSSE